MQKYKPEVLNGVPVPYNISIAELQTNIKSSDDQAWAAILALAHKKEPEALDILVDLTNSKDWRYRRSAIEAIGLSVLGQKASEIICQLLNDKVVYVVRSAIEAAAYLKLDCVHKKVIDIVKMSDSNTKISALGALEVLWEPGDFDTVFGLYLNDSSSEVRKKAASVIANNIDKLHWKLVFSKFITDTIPNHRVWACKILGDFGDKTDISSLKDAKNDTNGHVRKAAERAANILSSNLNTRLK